MHTTTLCTRSVFSNRQPAGPASIPIMNAAASQQRGLNAGSTRPGHAPAVAVDAH